MELLLHTTQSASSAVEFRNHADLQQVGESQFVWLPVFQMNASICANNLIFRLKNPVNVSVSREQGMWLYESASLGIVAYGESQADAQRSFSEDFAALYGHLAEDADENLTPDAIAIKRELHRVVEKVRRVGQ